MSNGREFDEPAVYQIRVKGTLDRRWSDWFDGFTITPQAHDETLLTGPVVDQAALHGLLAKIRDLGLPLLSIQRAELCRTGRRDRGRRGGLSTGRRSKVSVYPCEGFVIFTRVPVEVK